MFPIAKSVSPSKITDEELYKVNCLKFHAFDFLNLSLYHILNIKEWSQVYNWHYKLFPHHNLSMQSIPHHSSVSIMQNTGLGKAYFYQCLLKDGKMLNLHLKGCRLHVKSVQLDSSKTSYSGKLGLKFNMSTH